jgi:creatinine amidohydrolase
MLGPKNTREDIERAGAQTAVLGVGAWEQHGPHLPLETDWLFAAEVSHRVAERLDLLLLHPLPYSTSLEHIGFAGTITLSPETLRNTIWDIAASCGRWGIRYLALINAHGGNFVLNPTVRQWNLEGRTPHILLVDLFAAWQDAAPNLHAGEVETSMMLHLDPARVDMGKCRDFVPERDRQYLTHVGMRGVCPEGVWGNPTRATATKGKRWLEEAVQYSARRVEQLREAFGTVGREGETRC